MQESTFIQRSMYGVSVRTLEILGKGETSLGHSLLDAVRSNLSDCVTSAQASDIVAETASGGVAGTLIPPPLPRGPSTQDLGS